MANISHNTPGMPGQTNRRNLLKALPAVAILPAAATSAMAATETPVMQLFREWQKMTEWLNGPETKGMPCSEFDALVDVRHALELRMFAEPAQDVADVLAKITAYTEYGICDMLSNLHFPEIWAEARVLLGGAV